MLNKLREVFKFWNNDVIEFYCHPDLNGVIPEPRPAIKYLPEWFRILPPTLPDRRDGMFNVPSMSAKKCFPLIDAMALGYVIPLCGDLHIQVDPDMTELKAHNPPGLKLAEFHSVDQLGGENAPRFPLNPIKFVNHWIIKTAPGWSTLFVSPMNHIDQPFTCLSGLVDTDKYPKEVNFPAIWNKPGFDGIISAGTPLVTAIPIKRNTFDKKPKIRKMTNDDYQTIEKIKKQQHSRMHVYTNELRVKR
jgi:hypothetical protein